MGHCPLTSQPFTSRTPKPANVITKTITNRRYEPTFAMTRTPPSDQLGGTHFLTISIAKRQAVFALPTPAQLFCQTLADVQREADFAIYAFVVMPDHAHILLNLDAPRWNITHFAWLVKGKSGRAIAQWAREQDVLPNGWDLLQPAWLATDQPHHRNWQFRIWQTRTGYDFIVWSAQKLWQKIDYIHQNPVRAQLVALPEAYPYSSAANYAGLEEIHHPIQISFPNEAFDHCR